MRLIDADALIEAIRSHYENVHCEDAVLNNFYRLAHEHVIDVVNIQKTAFDTEKVVKQLLDMRLIRVEQCHGDYEIEVMTESNFDDAIDIVRKGGIE